MRKRKGGGGFTPKNHVSSDPGLIGPKHRQWGEGGKAGGGFTLASRYHDWGEGYARGGSVRGGSGSGPGRLRNTRAAAKVPDKTEL